MNDTYYDIAKSGFSWLPAAIRLLTQVFWSRGIKCHTAALLARLKRSLHSTTNRKNWKRSKLCRFFSTKKTASWSYFLYKKRQRVMISEHTGQIQNWTGRTSILWYLRGVFHPRKAAGHPLASSPAASSRLSQQKQLLAPSSLAPTHCRWAGSHHHPQLWPQHLLGTEVPLCRNGVNAHERGTKSRSPPSV